MTQINAEDQKDSIPDEIAELAPGLVVQGTVVRAAGGMYEVNVRLDNTDAHGEAHPTLHALICSLRGVLKKGKKTTSQPVAVGDDVLVRVLETTGADARGRRLREGNVEEVLPRRTVLARSRYNKTNQVTVANLDQVVVVMALREPDLNTHRLDRFLVLAEAADLHPIIVLNKVDLLKKREIKSEVEPIRKLYTSLGYDVAVVSSETDAGILELRKLLEGHISAVVGSSGDGNSSLVNAVQPGLHLWVGDVMEIGKGRHTTTDVSLHPLDGGGFLADTPGVKTVSLLEREDVNLPQCFPEIRELGPECKFNNCTHTHEPGCAVRTASESGDIAASRYDSYLKMHAEGDGSGNKKQSVLAP
ncbi:MAG TPA: ribosome small subunit-dependent GTPase A [Abditibacteriaceae bacterium]